MKSRLEAENYIKKSLKSDDTIKADKQIKDIKWNKINVNHAGLCNTLAKLASIVPMPKISREIIIYKLANPGISDTQMAIMAGIRATEIMAYEAEGKSRIAAYIDRYSEQEMINKANANGIALDEIRNLKIKQAPGGSERLN